MSDSCIAPAPLLRPTSAQQDGKESDEGSSQARGRGPQEGNEGDEDQEGIEVCPKPFGFWSNDCLNFHNNKRSVKSASDTQVRSKIYASSIDSWKNYEKYLNEYFEKLKN